MVSFGRQSDFRVGDEDFQDIRGVGLDATNVVWATHISIQAAKGDNQQKHQGVARQLLLQKVFINDGQKATAHEALELLIGLAGTELSRSRNQDKKLRVKELLECQPRFSISQSGSLHMVKFIGVSVKEGMFNNVNVLSAPSLWTASPLCRELLLSRSK
nr:hypothetical protein [Tanacetum cinerariifolium]